MKEFPVEVVVVVDLVAGWCSVVLYPITLT